MTFKKEVFYMSKYSEELKSKVIRLHLQEGRSQSSLEKEFNIGRGSIYYWLKSYNKECQNNPSKAQEKQGDCPKIKKKRHRKCRPTFVNI